MMGSILNSAVSEEDSENIQEYVSVLQANIPFFSSWNACLQCVVHADLSMIPILHSPSQKDTFSVDINTVKMSP